MKPSLRCRSTVSGTVSFYICTHIMFGCRRARCGAPGAGYQSSLFGHFSFGLPSDRINKFTDRWTYSGEKLSFGTSLAYTVSEQVWLVFCFTCHDSIHFSGSRPFIDSPHVMVHVELAVACVLSMRVENQGHHYAVSHAPTGQ